MQSKRSMMQLLGVALLAAMAGACLNYPRNGQTMATKATEVSFEGFYNSPSHEIRLYIRNNTTAAWEHLQHPLILTGTNAMTDNAGEDWYFFSQKVTLPQGSAYWGAAPAGKRTVIAKVKANVVGNNNAEVSLTTFDVDADGCIDTYKPQGGAAIRQNCASGESPIVTLHVSCGAASAICCLASPACDYGKNCASGSCTTSCGGQGQQCCQASPGCGANTICSNNTCIHCGATGETCCSNSQCASGNVCKNGSCVLCGAIGQTCCASSACNAGGVCSNGSCVNCGSTGELCCSGSSCDAGNVCKNGSCTLCGATGQACCAGNACNSSGNVCSGGVCTTCGGSGQPCCAGGGCTQSGQTCISGTCQTPPCGGALQPCCGGTSCDVPADPTNPNALVCVNPGALGTCQPCGGVGERCCQGSYGCNGSLGCTSKYHSYGTCENCGTYDNCPPVQ